MIRHTDLGKNTFERSRRLKELIDAGAVALGGNLKLKIYGRLDCASGKRMKPLNRVFFGSQADAVNSGFRPCGHCMRDEYNAWKARKQ